MGDKFTRVFVLSPLNQTNADLCCQLNHAGFERPDSGDIALAGRSVIGLPAHKRGIGVVFQNFALFPHMTVAENIAFPLQVRRVPHAEQIRKVRAALDLVRLPGLGDRLPSQLSGGQQQRVAICRALLQQPQLLLADEPIASLDPRNAQVVMDALRRINREDGLTVLCNLHHLDTARYYCDRIIAMQDGRFMFDGTPAELTAEKVREVYGVTEDEFHSAAPSGSLAAA